MEFNALKAKKLIVDANLTNKHTEMSTLELTNHFINRIEMACFKFFEANKTYETVNTRVRFKQASKEVYGKLLAEILTLSYTIGYDLDAIFERCEARVIKTNKEHHKYIRHYIYELTMRDYREKEDREEMTMLGKKLIKRILQMGIDNKYDKQTMIRYVEIAIENLEKKNLDTLSNLE